MNSPVVVLRTFVYLDVKQQRLAETVRFSFFCLVHLNMAVGGGELVLINRL